MRHLRSTFDEFGYVCEELVLALRQPLVATFILVSALLLAIQVLQANLQR